MIEVNFKAGDFDGVIEEVLGLARSNMDKYIFYFDGWDGYGATAFLSYMARALQSMKDPPLGLRFDRIVYLDCSMWKSRRAMQRKIAEELKLDNKTMVMFEQQDEEDDFNGVDHGSRDVIRNVAAVIDKTLRESRFMVIFINGSDDEIILNPFGIPEYHDCVIIWTYRRFNANFSSETSSARGVRDLPLRSIRQSSAFLRSSWGLAALPTSHLIAMLHEEAAILACLRDMDPTMATNGFLYSLFMYHSDAMHITSRSLREVQDPSSYWICDGVIQGDKAREISNALHPKIGADSTVDGQTIASYLSRNTPYLIGTDDDLFRARGGRHYRWITITLKDEIASKNKKVQDDMQTTLATASTIILGSERGKSPCALVDVLFKQCNNLRLLILARCSFSFGSPPFLHCHTLRFLELDYCTDTNKTKPEGRDNRIQSKWACLSSLWVLRLHYTEWGEILSEEKIDLMANLEELDIEGVWCWKWVSDQLEKRLPNLQRLRVIKPVHQADTSTDHISKSLVDKTKLEVIDLSGNTHMKELPTNLSKASRLQELILDGCVGLENVVLAKSSLKSFSFDGCKHVLGDADKQYVKISKISLEGCTQLEKLILCGLPNLVELDLSGCAIKILDLRTTVKDFPRLKRLFLLGCKHLRAIRSESLPDRLSFEPSHSSRFQGLLCVDTRAARMLGCTRPSIAQHEGFGLQVHAIIADARLARSLWNLIYERYDGTYFNINITSSTACIGSVQRPEATIKQMTESSDQQQYVVPGLYGDVFSEVGDAPIPMQAFPQPPALQSDRHIEIGDGSHNLKSEVEALRHGNLGTLLAWYTKSLYVHDALATAIMPAGRFISLRWCRVERCPNVDAVFPSGAKQSSSMLESIWASDLLKARSIWSKSREVNTRIPSHAGFGSLRHLHLRSCPWLQYALPVWRPAFQSLETLHIIHCGSLRHVFEQDDVQQSSVQFPKLTTIHLHDLPALQQICETTEMLAPSLETIKIRGCWSLRRLPALKGRELDTKKPTVEVEKDVWDALEWDGVDAGHHPSLYEAPIHSRYYKQSRLLRGTVLR